MNNSAASMSADNMLASFEGKCRISPINPSEVPDNYLGLQNLARCSAWKYVIERCSGSTTSQDYSAKLIRLEALFRLKMFDDLSFEANNMLAHEKQRSNLPGQTNEITQSSLVISLQLLLAEVKAMTGSSEESFQLLYRLRTELNVSHVDNNIPIDTNCSKQLNPTKWWILRCSASIINAAVRQRLWCIAVNELQTMLKSVQSIYSDYCATNDIHNTPRTTTSYHQVEIILLCRLSRILLQVTSFLIYIYILLLPSFAYLIVLRYVGYSRSVH